MEFNVALYLSYQDLKNFFLVNKTALSLVNDKHFWQKKFKIDDLPSDNYLLIEYKKLIEYKRRVKLVLLINDIESSRKTDQTDGYLTIKFIHKITNIIPFLPEQLRESITELEKKMDVFDGEIIMSRYLEQYRLSFLLGYSDFEGEVICGKDEIIKLLTMILYYNYQIENEIGENRCLIFNTRTLPYHYNTDQRKFFHKRIAILETLEYLDTCQ